MVIIILNNIYKTITNQKGYWELARLDVRTNKTNDSFRVM